MASVQPVGLTCLHRTTITTNGLLLDDMLDDLVAVAPNKVHVSIRLNGLSYRDLIAALTDLDLKFCGGLPEPALA